MNANDCEICQLCACPEKCCFESPSACVHAGDIGKTSIEVRPLDETCGTAILLANFRDGNGQPYQKEVGSQACCQDGTYSLCCYAGVDGNLYAFCQHHGSFISPSPEFSYHNLPQYRELVNVLEQEAGKRWGVGKFTMEMHKSTHGTVLRAEPTPI